MCTDAMLETSSLHDFLSVSLLFLLFHLFSSPQLSSSRCEIPPNTGEESRMQLLVSWIIDHPDAVSEEEVKDMCS